MGSAGFWSEGAKCGEDLYWICHCGGIVFGAICRGGVVGSIVVGIG